MREPITLPRNPSKSFIAANPQLYGHLSKTADQTKAKLGSPAVAKKERKARAPSELEEKFARLWADTGGSDFEYRREYKFAPTRRWRLDYAFPAQRIYVELEGGVHCGGRHNRAGGFIDDCEKYNAATFHGWTGFRLPTGGVTEEIVTQIQDFIRRRC